MKDTYATASPQRTKRRLSLASNHYSLIVLDLGLPDEDGLHFLTRMRREKMTQPVLILTARDTLEDRISGLDTGADDYLVKPFALEELECAHSRPAPPA